MAQREPDRRLDPWRGALDQDAAAMRLRRQRLAADLRRIGEEAHRRGLPLIPLKGTYLGFERYPDPPTAADGKRRYERYDLLDSDSRFTSAVFEAVWFDLFDGT
jgi:hypothetical protein